MLKIIKEEKIIDFKDNNLHLIGYSIPISKTISKKLIEHLHSLPSQPNAILILHPITKNIGDFAFHTIKN